MAAAAEEGVGGEVVGGGSEVRVVEVSYWGVVVFEVGVASSDCDCDCGFGIAREVTHDDEDGVKRESVEKREWEHQHMGAPKPIS